MYSKNTILKNNILKNNILKNNIPKKDILKNVFLKKNIRKKVLFMALSLLLVFGMIAETGLLVMPTEAAEKISNPETRWGADGIDPNPAVGRHNSYAWAGEMFRQDDGDYLWVATNRDLAGHAAGSAGIDLHNFAHLDPESEEAQLLAMIPPVSPDGAARIYRQRASDATAPWEVVFADPRINGFRRMITFNGDLYVVAGITNTPVADYSYILRFSSCFRPGDRPDIVLWQELANPDLIEEAHLAGSAFEHFRAASVLDDRLYIGTFDGRVYSTDGTGLRNLTPLSGDYRVGWELVVDLSVYDPDETPIVWDILGFNGYMYIFSVTSSGFRVDKVRAAPGGYAYGHVIEHIVGPAPARLPHGLGNPANMAASGFLSTSFGEDFVYVSTFSDGPAKLTNFTSGEGKRVFTENFNPASIFRFDRDDNWEVIVGERSGRLAARDWQGNYLPRLGNQRAGFSILPEYRENTSLNQYVWWMAEHNGRLYASTFNLSSIWDYGLWSLLELQFYIPGMGMAVVANGHLPTWRRIHESLARESHFIDFVGLYDSLDAYLVSVADAPRDSREARRVINQGFFETFSRYLPSPEFQVLILEMVYIMLDVFDFLEEEPCWRDAILHAIPYHAVSSLYYADDLSPTGFDLFVSEDGINFESITVNGFGDPLNYGGRVLVPSEHGLHVLTANPFYGGQVWRADPMRLEVLPNGPRVLNLGRTSMRGMTVLINDAGTAGGNLQVSYDSDLVDVRVVRRSGKTEVSHFTWDNQAVFYQPRDLWHYVVTETETRHTKVMYDVFFTPRNAGQESLTLEFELDGVSSSRSIDLNVYFPGFADRAALVEKMMAVSTLNRSNFTVESWLGFLTAYGNAMAIYNNPNATQAQVNNALFILTMATHSLVPSAPPPGATIITTETQLRRMRRNGNYWLGNDITLTRPWSPILNFSGTLNGNGRTIYNLEITRRARNQGLFRTLAPGGQVTDLRIHLGPRGIIGGNQVGALAGFADRSTIIGVQVVAGHDGVVGNGTVGGLVGRTRGAIIVGSFVYGHNGMSELYAGHPEADNVIAVRGTGRGARAGQVGGLVGVLDRSMIAYSASYVNVAGFDSVGGLVGDKQNGVISDSFSRGRVHGLTTVSRGRHSRGERIGGLIGVSSGQATFIENVYASGVVRSYGRRYINPLIGQVRNTLLTRGVSFYDRDVAGISSVAMQDLSNIQATDPIGTVLGGVRGETTHNLQLASTFTQNGTNWDFETVWTVGTFQGTAFHLNTYPHFIAGVALASTPPVIRSVVHTDRIISGVGSSEGAIIRVELPDGTQLETETDYNLQWSVELPRGTALSSGAEITVTQEEIGLPESTESTTYIQVNRPINLFAGLGSQNISNPDCGQYLPGEIVRFRVEIENQGEENEHTDRIQILNELPAGVTFVPGSVRLVTENEDGEESRSNISRNTSNVGSSGHSFNAGTGNLEIRLGSHRLRGYESIAVEFDVIIDRNVSGVAIDSIRSTITGHRVSSTSPYNIVTVEVEAEGFRVE